MSADVPNPFAYSVPPAEIAAPAELVPESPPGKIAVWPVFAVYVAALVASIAAQIPVVLAWVVVHVARGGKASDASALIASPAGFISLVLPAQFCFLAAWWLATRYADRRLVGLRAIGSTTLPAWSYASLAIGSLGTLQLGDYLAQGMQRLIGDWSQELVPNLFKDLDLATGLLLVAVIGLVPPLAEELFFRGYMQRRLLARWSPWIALPVVAVLFAASHGAPDWAVAVLPLGLWIGIMAWRTGSLLPSIITHAFVNGGINAWRLGAKLGAWPEEVSTPIAIAGWGVVVCSLAVSIWLLVRYRPPDTPPAQTA